jgi:hypothetical protein
MPGRAIMVNSPYAGKLFKLPPQQQASNSAIPHLESKIETPKTESPH